MRLRRRAADWCIQGLALGLLVSGLSAQTSETRSKAGVPEDWTHHRVRFSTRLLRRHPERVAREPRAAMQLYRAASAEMRRTGSSSLPISTRASFNLSIMQRDWAASLGSGHVEFGQFPAKWQMDPEALPSCMGDYLIFALNVPGVTGGQPSIVALNNLYVGGTDPLCPGLRPNFLFSYNTTTVPNGKILTSPILSVDGKKVAFIETVTTLASKKSILHVLRVPTAGTQATAIPSKLPPVGAMSSLVLAAATNLRSSPWIDYSTDTIYVGLDNGKVYKVTGVFKGTPALAGSPWPITINLNSILSSPIFDSFTGKLFVGAANGTLYSVLVSSPAAMTAIRIGRADSANPGIYDAPMFDATGGSIFAITSNDDVSNGASVVQVNADTLSITTRVSIGQGTTKEHLVNLYDGDFDENYFNDPSTGHMMVCGTGTADSTPHRYVLGFDGDGVLQPGSSIQISSSPDARCSPITEFFNPNVGTGTEFFFWGVTRGCPGFGNSGCVMALADGATLTSMQSAGGASGIVIDNIYTTKTGGSSIYFSTLGTPGAAVQLTQNGLQ